MSWIQYLPQILAAIAMGLTLGRPWLIAHGVPEALIDQLIVLFGQGTVAATRANINEPSTGITYGASAVGAASIGAGLLGIVGPNTALTMAGAAMGVSALGFNNAVRRMNVARKPL